MKVILQAFEPQPQPFAPGANVEVQPVQPVRPARGVRVQLNRLVADTRLFHAL